MKKSLVGIAAIASLAMGSAQAHFQLVYTPEVMLEKPAEITLDLVFGHPMENGHTMDMDKPEQFYVLHKDKKADLVKGLKSVTWKGAHNEAKAFETTYKVKRNGDYIFVLVPAPYYEKGEDIYIQQITKSYLNKGSMPTGWNEPQGLKTEIIPMNKPYQIFAGGTFTGQLLSNGKPVEGAECEIEYINTAVDVKGNSFGKDNLGDVPATAIVAMTGADGMFTFGIPKPGVWGFACLGSGPDTEYKGKELSQDAVIWINATELK
jgi:cobalt/nickel transport protein